jgi:hypothetical protein
MKWKLRRWGKKEEYKATGGKTHKPEGARNGTNVETIVRYLSVRRTSFFYVVAGGTV